MKRAPDIVVQLIHIHGPMKGEIQEFSERVILVGRHPSCHLRFPADMNSISRKHAEIIREGNQFKLTDHSTNGTFVNGKQVHETFLRDGDVLEFAKGGPKVSILTQMKETQAVSETSPPHPREEPHRAPEAVPQDVPQGEPRYLEEEPRTVEPNMEEPVEMSVQRISVPLIIQYGPTLRSFTELPLTIGTSLDSGFVLDHPAVFARHAQIFFSDNHYWIKDLTGQNSVCINGQPIGFHAPLKINDEIALTPEGPFFQFLGEGRLVEVMKPDSEDPSGPHDRLEQRDHPEPPAEKGRQQVLSKIKKFLKH